MYNLSKAESLEDAFCEALDDQGDVTICGVTFSRSQILKEMDPIAYDEELSNFFDAMGFDPDSEDEDDGQPTEQEEWHSFDPDC